jgi:D-sedoheptulose 7-phosphate isomerase
MANASERVRQTFAESIRVKQATAEAWSDEIAGAVTTLAECFRAGGKLLTFGNGGSAADAQHIASEFVGRYVRDRPALPAIALTTNSSEYTAIGNDYGFGHVFVRGIEAHGRVGDVAIAISTSGNSENLVEAIHAAKGHGLTTIGLLGKGGGKLQFLVDQAIIVPSEETPRIQETHITIGHVLCALVEDALFPQKSNR